MNRMCGSFNILLLRLKTLDGESCCFWAYEKGYDRILEMLRREAVNLLDLLPESAIQSIPPLQPGISGSGMISTGGVVPLPSPMGKIRHITKEKAEVRLHER